MELNLKRFKSDKEATLGNIFVGDMHECYCLEPQKGEIKNGETVVSKGRIPAGNYEIVKMPYGASRFDASYSARFGAFYTGMLQLKGVQGFEGIDIHIGNWNKDTHGCILCGQGFDDIDGKFEVTNSEIAFNHLYAKIVQALDASDKVDIDISDEDGSNKPPVHKQPELIAEAASPAVEGSQEVA